MHPLISDSIFDEGGPVRVQGFSMFPRFFSGSTVAVEAVKVDELKLGDIVLTQFQGGQQLHRLIRPIQESKFQTAGDFTRGAEVPLSEKYLIGRVKEPTHLFGRILEALMCNLTLWRYS